MNSVVEQAQYPARVSIPDGIFNEQRFLLALESEAPIPLCKATIKAVSDFLDAEFQAGSFIRDLITERSRCIDGLLRGLWQHFGLNEQPNLALIAVGGYGRGELHPYSDIDLLILGADDDFEDCADAIGQFITLLWDIKLDIGHSVRSLEQCVDEARADLTVITNLIESRLITGSAALHRDLMNEVSADKIWNSADFFFAKFKEQRQRHKKSGNTEYQLEPNLKTSPGGLRDLQVIGWIANRHFGVKRLRDLLPLGFLSEEEIELIKQGREYLWHLRYALHIHCDREEDRLLFEHQRALAKSFGFVDEDSTLAVEKFMQVYYRWAFTLGELNELLIQYFEEDILKACEAEHITEINPRFRIRNNFIEVTNDRVFLHSPSALLEVFVLLAQTPNIVGVRASTIRLIRKYAYLVDDFFRSESRNQKWFLELLASPYKVTTQLRRMSRYGILPKYIPEFAAIMGQMQHDLFHIYTVDAHTLATVNKLRRFGNPDRAKSFPIAHHIVRNVPRVELLYIAALFHDLGKGRSGDHSELGAIDARRFCERHGLTRRETNLVSWLVANHLLMPQTSRRKDLSDPEAIRDFANQVGDTHHLDHLYALSVADMLATNDTVWNSWRAALMRQLYMETRRMLRRGLDIHVDKSDWIEDNQKSAIQKLKSRGFTEAQILEIWDNPGDDYFLRESSSDIAWQTEAIALHPDREQPLVLIKETTTVRQVEGATQIFIYTRNSPYLFAAIADALEKLDLSIQDARIYNSNADFAIDTFIVLDADGNPIERQRETEIRDTLAEQLQDPSRFSSIISRRTPRRLQHFSAPTEASIRNDPERDHSILELVTPDRPGLLARLGKIFVEYDIQIQNARITTHGERVEDIFFITDSNGQAITDSQRCSEIEHAICERLDEHASQ